MKTKQIACPNCGGLGFITTIYVSGRSSRMCPDCNGTGLQEVAATNADRIRAMSDEELAEVLCAADFCGYCEYERDNGICHYIDLHPNGKLFDGCAKAALKWLQQPKEDVANA